MALRFGHAVARSVQLYPPGARKKSPAGDAAAGGAFGFPSSPLSPMSGMASASDMEEAEAGEVTLPVSHTVWSKTYSKLALVLCM